MTRAAFLVAASLLAACSAEPAQPGGVTADEARQLNEAAAMLDNDSGSADVLGNGSAPR